MDKQREQDIIISNGEMSKLICSYEWEYTLLGPMRAWPQSLVTAANLILNSPVPMVLLWGARGIMLYNDAFAAFAGKDHSRLLGMNVSEALKESADFHQHVLATCLKGETLQYESQQLTLYRGGKLEDAWLDLTYSPVVGESGRPEGVLAVLVDVTERELAEQQQKKAEASLQRERQRLQTIFMQAPTSIAILHGPDHIITLANAPYLKLVGHKSIIGKPIEKALPELVTRSFVDILDTVFRTGTSHFSNEVALNVREKNKGATRYLNFAYQPYHDENGVVEGILLHAVDVTDQVQARQQVEEIANLNKTITDNATTGMMIMDADHYLTYMNPAAVRITGYTMHKIQKQHKTLHDIVHPVHPDGTAYPIEDCPTSKALLNKKRILSEDFFIRPDGTSYPVSIMTTPIIRDGEMVGIVEEIRDISKEKAAEREILELNKELEERVARRTEQLTTANKELNRSNEELQDFAYVASHDLQEPLRKIAAFSSLLGEDYGDRLPEAAHVYLDGLQKSSARMRTLINDLLTYSRVTTQAHPFEPIDATRVVREVLEDLQARIDETGAKVTIGELPRIEADPLQLRLLFQNLLSNALKYIRPGSVPKVTMRSETVDGNAVISVRDNGIGFEERYLDRIFTIFQRLHGKNDYEGTGVGLAICKKIVDRHGGTITARSKLGEGSTFIVSIPLTQKVQAD